MAFFLLFSALVPACLAQSLSFSFSFDEPSTDIFEPSADPTMTAFSFSYFSMDKPTPEPNVSPIPVSTLKPVTEDVPYSFSFEPTPTPVPNFVPISVPTAGEDVSYSFSYSVNTPTPSPTSPTPVPTTSDFAVVDSVMEIEADDNPTETDALALKVTIATDLGVPLESIDLKIESFPLPPGRRRRLARVVWITTFQVQVSISQSSCGRCGSSSVDFAIYVQQTCSSQKFNQHYKQRSRCNSCVVIPESVVCVPKTRAPTPQPYPRPTPRPTLRTPKPTYKPTKKPVPVPTPFPSPKPTNKPVPVPTPSPSPKPTNKPVPEPTPAPTFAPTEACVCTCPTKSPSPAPTEHPTSEPTPNYTPNCKETKSVVVVERNEATLRCSQGTIKISKSWYGIENENECTSQCADTIPIAKKLCNDKETCTVIATNTAMQGDPAQGKPKTLRMKYCCWW